MSKNKNQPIKGYKVFKPDWTCMGFQYEVGRHSKKMLHLLVATEDFIFAKN